MLLFIFLVLTSLSTWAIINISNRKKNKVLSKIVHRQSSIHEIVKNYIPKKMFEKEVPLSQSRKHIQKNMIKVIMSEGKAYWVVDNVFYVAGTVNGRIDPETVEPLDIINMPEQQLNKMLDILDNLKMGSGSNDGGSSGHDRL